MIGILMPIVIIAIIVIHTIVIIGKPRRRPRGRKEALSLSPLKPPNFDLDFHCRSPLPLCSLHVRLSTVSASLGRRLPYSATQPGAEAIGFCNHDKTLPFPTLCQASWDWFPLMA